MNFHKFTRLIGLMIGVLVAAIAARLAEFFGAAWIATRFRNFLVRDVFDADENE